MQGKEFDYAGVEFDFIPLEFEEKEIEKRIKSAFEEKDEQSTGARHLVGLQKEDDR